MGEFHKFPKQYIHHMKQRSDTGLAIELLQEYTFIAIDIFKDILHNKGVKECNKLDAWILFLSVDEPELIIQLIGEYPEFEPLYREVYEMCRNMEDFMGIFSEELAILDKNTVDYMIDEMQNTIDEQDKTINKLKKRQNNLNRLTQSLIADNRLEELARSAEDEEFQDQLLLEYGLL